MGEYRGSLSNLPPFHRFGVIFLAFVLPALFFVLFLFSLIYVSLWGFLLILFLVSLLISISILGTFNGQRISIDHTALNYRKGLGKGTIPLDMILIAYKVKAADRTSVLVVFNDRSSQTSPYRCLTVEQTFSEADMEDIFSELRHLSRRNRFKIIPEASLTQIRTDKERLNWAPV